MIYPLLSLSLLVPAYFGYVHTRYWTTIVWALVCTGIFFWLSRSSVSTTPARSQGAHQIYAAVRTAAAVMLVAFGFLLTHAGVHTVVLAMTFTLPLR